MVYAISPSKDQKYIVLKHWGELNGKLAMERVVEAHVLGAKLGIARYLVDLTEAKNVDTVTKSYRYAYQDTKTLPEIDKNVRVAMLVSHDDHSHDFVETVLRNAGHNVMLFRERELAIKHLLAETQDP
jgi:hypothetical protein